MTLTKRKIPKLNSYELSKEIEPAEASSFSDSVDQTNLTKIIIKGENIVNRALEPIVKIGNITVKFPQISLDQSSIIGYIDETPPEGATISLQYGFPNKSLEVQNTPRTELPEKFTIKKLEDKK
jgi:hypothetical protein